MIIQIFVCSRTISSWFHSDFSDRVDWTKGGFSPYLLRGLFIVAALIVGFSAVHVASAQVPAPPPASEPSQQQPQQAPPSPPEPQVPLQQYPIQQPGRPSLTPAEPPSTTIPPWTPPLPPPPSQTNIPTPFPILGPGAGQVGTPGLTIPGAFRPTLATVRGAALEFHPTLRAAEEYTDNFFQTTSRTEENFRSILGPGFTLLLNGARTFGTLSTTVDLVHDTAPDSGDDLKVFPSFNAAIRYALTPRLGLTFTDTFVRNDSSSATADPSGIRRGRQTFDTNQLTVAVDWLLDQVATQAYYRNLLFFNEDDDNEGDNQQNRVSRGDTITHILGLNASTRVAVDYIVRAGYEFSRSDVSGGGTGTDTTTHTGFGSVARQFGLYTTAGVSSTVSYQTDESTRIYNASLFGAYGLPTGLSLSGSVGYSILQSDAEDTEGGVSANFNASYRFARAVLSVGVFQDFRQTGQQGENFGTVESRSYFGSFLYQFTPFINGIARVTYSENEPTGTGNVRSSRSQTTLTYGASLNWQVLRWLTASLDYTYTKQTGGDVFGQSAFGGTGNYAENRFRLALFATF